MTITPPPCCETNGPFIFISYSHKDMELVFPHIYAFQEKNIAIWYDKGLELGEPWFIDVKAHLNMPNCVGVIFYVSENTILSDSVKKEMLITKKSPVASRYFACNLMDISIEDAIDRSCGKKMQDDKDFDELTEDFYRSFFNKDKTFVFYSAPDCFDTMCRHITKNWKYDADSAVFPNCNVLHAEHTEYLPALLDLTPGAYTFLVASDKNRNVASTLNQTCRKRTHWEERRIVDFTENMTSLPDACDGLILVATKANISHLTAALELRAEEYPRIPLLLVIADDRLEAASEILADIRDVVSDWRETRGISHTDAGFLDEFLLVQTTEEDEGQKAALPMLMEQSLEKRWRTLLSGGQYYEDVWKCLSKKGEEAAEKWLLAQIPPFFENRLDTVVVNLRADAANAYLYNRDIFRE